MTPHTFPESFPEFLTRRFGGVLTHGRHTPDGVACALEAWSQYEARTWTDDPVALNMPDLRALNDACWSDDAIRALWMGRVLSAVTPVWRDPGRRPRFVAGLAIGTIRDLLPPRLRAIGLDEHAAA